MIQKRGTFFGAIFSVFAHFRLAFILAWVFLLAFCQLVRRFESQSMKIKPPSLGEVSLFLETFRTNFYFKSNSFKVISS